MGDRHKASSYFPKDLDEHAALSVIRYLQDWTIEAAKSDLSGFFQSLVAALSSAFEAELVTIWDNNEHGGCLVLQASLPECRSVLASHTVPTDTSLTGLAVCTKDFEYHSNLLGTTNGRHFANPDIVRELDLSSMVSVPVF